MGTPYRGRLRGAAAPHGSRCPFAQVSSVSFHPLRVLANNALQSPIVVRECGHAARLVPLAPRVCGVDFGLVLRALAPAACTCRCRRKAIRGWATTARHSAFRNVRPSVYPMATHPCAQRAHTPCLGGHARACAHTRRYLLVPTPLSPPDRLSFQRCCKRLASASALHGRRVRRGVPPITGGLVSRSGCSAGLRRL